MKKLLLQMTALLLLAAALALAANTWGPRRIPWAEDWGHAVEARAVDHGLAILSLQAAREAFDEGRTLWLDARSRADYRAGHIPGALSSPFDRIEEVLADVGPFLAPDVQAAAYCSGGACDESFLLALALREQGYTNVVLFAGGLAAWEEAGLPVERSASW